jgi:hypothetical protein
VYQLQGSNSSGGGGGGSSSSGRSGRNTSSSATTTQQLVALSSALRRLQRGEWLSPQLSSSRVLLSLTAAENETFLRRVASLTHTLMWCHPHYSTAYTSLLQTLARYVRTPLSLLPL